MAANTLLRLNLQWYWWNNKFYHRSPGNGGNNILAISNYGTINCLRNSHDYLFGAGSRYLNNGIITTSATNEIGNNGTVISRYVESSLTFSGKERILFSKSSINNVIGGNYIADLSGIPSTSYRIEMQSGSLDVGGQAVGGLGSQLQSAGNIPLAHVERLYILTEDVGSLSAPIDQVTIDISENLIIPGGIKLYVKNITNNGKIKNIMT